MSSMAARDVPSAVGIKALGLDGLARLVDELGEPSYRAGQLARWLYQRTASSYDQMTDLPAGLRELLARRLALPFPQVLERQLSEDGTRKYLLQLADGVTVEAVGLPTSDRLTVCFSTQAGCAMGCAFCATGASGLTRDLGPGEMVDQLSIIASDFGQRVTNAVAMGQGEPFANYENVLAALRLMNSAKGLGIGARHLTISTCGLVNGIRRLAAEHEQFTLAVSLHSAVQETRDRLMPGLSTTPLEELRDALVDYATATSRRPSLEYALVEAVNDSPEELRALIGYCRGLLVHVNLIPINPVEGTGMERPRSARVREFQTALSEAGVEVSIRAERGSDIDAACGQLRQRSTS
jgi:23S rRNA (adenine2503-C2)-methyltransferase